MTLVGNRVVADAISEEEVMLGSVMVWCVEQSYDWDPDQKRRVIDGDTRVDE